MKLKATWTKDSMRIRFSWCLCVPHRLQMMLLMLLLLLMMIWVRSRNCGCLVTWFCYQLIAKPGNKTAAVSWPDPYVHLLSGSHGPGLQHRSHNVSARPSALPGEPWHPDLGLRRRYRAHRPGGETTPFHFQFSHRNSVWMGNRFVLIHILLMHSKYYTYHNRFV